MIAAIWRDGDYMHGLPQSQVLGTAGCAPPTSWVAYDTSFTPMGLKP